MKTVTKVEVGEVEKRRIPSKHYVYVIFVTWSNGGTYVIYRRYSRFFDFQSELLDKFPIEAGSIDPESRIIPFLPGKIIFGRSHIRDVAVKRLGPINEYCKAVVALPHKISQCEEVLDFFEVEEDDLDPPKPEEKIKNAVKKAEKISQPKNLKQYRVTCDYCKQDRGEIDLESGMLVEVVEKSDKGWWFVNSEDAQGWVPSTYLEPADGKSENITVRAKPGQEEKYICMEMFPAGGEDEICLQKGAVVEVLEKNLSGWWLVRHQGEEGFTPATYLKKTEDEFVKSLANRKSTDVEIIQNLADISNIMKNKDEPSGNTLTPDSCHSQGPRGDMYTKVHLKSRSLERGGNLKPPPRQSVKMKINGVSKIPESPTKTSHYVTIAEFNDTVGDGLSFKQGQSVHVKEKTESGWWFVTIENKDGWVPASYIQLHSDNQTFDKEEDLSVYTTIDDTENFDDWSSEEEPDQVHVEMRKSSKKKRNSLNIAEAIKSQLKKRRSNSDPESKFTVNDEKKPSKSKPLVLPSKLQNPVNIASGGSKSNDTDTKMGFNHGLANMLKSKFENRNNQFSDPQDLHDPKKSENRRSNSGLKPFLPPKTNSTEFKPPPRPKTNRHHKDNSNPSGVQVVKISNENNPQTSNMKSMPLDIPKICNANSEKSVTGNKPSVTPKPGVGTKPTIGTKPNIGSKPVIGSKPALGSKPSIASKPVLTQKPALPSKQAVSSKLSVDKMSGGPPKLPTMVGGPPKLPVKTTTSMNSDTNNNSDKKSVDSSSGVQGLAAALQTKFENKNSAPPKLPGKLNLPTKKPIESSSVSNKMSEIDKPKANVGSLVSALSGKLNFNSSIPPCSNSNGVHGDHRMSDHSQSRLQITDTLNNESNMKKSANNVNSNKIYVIAESFEAQTAEELSVHEGDHVKLCTETDSGWWMVSLNGKQGWVPTAYLVEKSPGTAAVAPPVPPHATPKRTSKIVYKTSALFTAENVGELGFDEGEIIDVIEQSDTDWWLIRIGDEEGWAPKSFIEKHEVEDTRASSSGKPPATPKIKPAFNFSINTTV